MEEKLARGQCVYPECEKGIASRGLCQKHYANVLRLIHRKITTWEELQKQGKIPKGKPSEVEEWALGSTLSAPRVPST